MDLSLNSHCLSMLIIKDKNVELEISKVDNLKFNSFPEKGVQNLS